MESELYKCGKFDINGDLFHQRYTKTRKCQPFSPQTRLIVCFIVSMYTVLLKNCLVKCFLSTLIATTCESDYIGRHAFIIALCFVFTCYQ